MKKYSKKTSLLLLSSLLFVTPIAFSSGSVIANAEEKADNSQLKTKYLSNQDLFDELEKQGYKLEDIFTKEEIKKYKAEDKLRAGKTQYIVTGEDSATLYLSSAYTKTIAALGAAGISVIAALTGGIPGAAAGGFFGSIAASNVDTSKGIYIKFKSKKNSDGVYVLTPIKWGYQ
ncbi:Uncharacterised protein [Staphylococcus delphini]|nr:Uncharacterised protein [Staphylococcus delphini]